MKPIETSYRGYLFRSRTEARWAVYFDALGLKWEYEPEGFELDGTRYLPDFRLPELHMWAEVKRETFSPEELYKVYLLSRYSEQFVLALDGPPDLRPYDAWLACQVPESSFIRKDGSWDPEIPREQFLGSGIDEKYGTGLKVLWYLNNMPFILGVTKKPSGSVILQPASCSEPDASLHSFNDQVRHAVNAARSARFEFGQSGATV